MSEPRPIRALVTAGGTAEPVDDVRVLTNRSTGRFGAAIANALAAAGVDVTLLGSEGLYARQLPLHGSIRQVRFESTDQLAKALDGALAQGTDLVFMAAAVSDYRPEAAAGKISSQAEERTLRLTRTPKLLDRLYRACPDAYLVGFKLLSGVSREELERVARGQIERAHLDLCVANDLQELGGPTHPVLLVDAQEALRVEGPRQVVAERLVRHALSQAGHAPRPWRASPAPEAIGGQVLTGPGTQLREVPQLSSDEPLPAALARALQAGSLTLPLPPEGRAFRRDGVDLLLLPQEAPFLDELGAQTAAWRARPEASQLAERLGAPLLFRPVLEDCELRGLLVEGPRGVALATPLPPLNEGSSERWAEELLATLSSERVLWVPGSRDLLEGRAFAPGETLGEWTSWSGPALRPDLRRGASICLFAPAKQSVLLGRRAKAPAEGCWAFPGGGREEGESAWESALRELREEAGVVLEARPAQRYDVFHGEAGRAYHVEGFVALSLDEAPPTSNGELTELGWYPLAEALELRPITPGTLRVLRDLS